MGEIQKLETRINQEIQNICLKVCNENLKAMPEIFEGLEYFPFEISAYETAKNGGGINEKSQLKESAYAALSGSMSVFKNYWPGQKSGAQTDRNHRR